jgi:hypothetical protein
MPRKVRQEAAKPPNAAAPRIFTSDYINLFHGTSNAAASDILLATPGHQVAGQVAGKERQQEAAAKKPPGIIGRSKHDHTSKMEALKTPSGHLRDYQHLLIPQSGGPKCQTTGAPLMKPPPSSSLGDIVPYGSCGKAAIAPAGAPLPYEMRIALQSELTRLYIISQMGNAVEVVNDVKVTLTERKRAGELFG